MKDKDLRKTLEQAGFIEEHDYGVSYNYSACYLRERISTIHLEMNEIEQKLTAILKHFRLEITYVEPGAPHYEVQAIKVAEPTRD